MKEDLYNNLIAKKLSGNISPEEQQLLRGWIEESPENKAWNEDMEQIWALSGRVSTPPSDVSAAWKRLEANLSTTPTRRLQANYRNLLRIAASFLLILSLAVLIRNLLVPAMPEVFVFESAATEKQPIVLPDGSQIELNESSKLTFAVAAGERLAELQGEAFFDVARQAGKPFIITCNGTTVRVLGTRFNIRNYPDQPVEVFVEEGTVSFSRQGDPDNMLILTAGSGARYNTSTNTIEELKFSDSNSLSWKYNRLVFADTQMDQVIQQLERHFGITIGVENPDILNCHFFGTFEAVSEKELLKSLAFSMDLKYSNPQPGVYLLEGKGCPE